MLSLAEMGLYVSVLLSIVGFLTVMIRKNLIFMMLGIEVILNAANLAFVSAGKLNGTFDGQVAMFFVIGVAACEAAIGLAMLISLYRSRSTIEADDLTGLKG